MSDDQVVPQEKMKMLLFSIIGEEIKAVKEKAMMLHKKSLHQNEEKIEEYKNEMREILVKKLEKYKSEKEMLMEKVEKYESENRRLKETLRAARRKLLELDERETDVLTLEKKLKDAEDRIHFLENSQDRDQGASEREDDVQAKQKKLDAAENRIQLLEKEKEKSEEEKEKSKEVCHQENGDQDQDSRSSLHPGNEMETSELSGPHTKWITGDQRDVNRTKFTQREGGLDPRIGSRTLDPNLERALDPNLEGVLDPNLEGVANRTRGSKRLGSETNANNENGRNAKKENRIKAKKKNSEELMNENVTTRTVSSILEDYQHAELRNVSSFTRSKIFKTNFTPRKTRES